MTHTEGYNPRNSEAERAVLGACMLSHEALGEVSGILKPEDFYNPVYSSVYAVLLDMYAENKPVDMLNVSDELRHRELFNKVGGQPLLAELMSSVSTTANVMYHAQIVKEFSTRRKLITAGDAIKNLSQKHEYEEAELINQAEKILFDVTQAQDDLQPSSLKELTSPVFASIQEVYKSGGRKLTGYSSGFEDLDKIISGFQPGSFNIIAARPSMGKTALALNIAQFGGDNSCVLIFSLEMSSEQLIHRMYSAESGVKLSSITTGIMSGDEFSRLSEASQYLSTRKIFIQDSSELNALEFMTKCRRFKSKNPDLALIIVDYLQLMRSSNKKIDNRTQEVTEISRVMKSVAKELNCPVIALSQLSRETEKRNSKKPQLSDLRDSGAIEQDADTVILLYRDDYYDDQNTELDSTAELRIAKNRTGATGSCKLTFRREYAQFVNYAEEY
ncbi:MAG: replicative DNA helicase [Synergistaceae bacterium]|nr:replicative DNA helicase [Synergistaceae bacterium]MBR0202894.1 replicative DNA helicase [Synergistaceae bacterium]